jgi:hypothetical protein
MNGVWTAALAGGNPSLEAVGVLPIVVQKPAPFGKVVEVGIMWGGRDRQLPRETRYIAEVLR